MKRVTGIGGIFFKAKDAAALQAWYKRHLGIDVQEWGGTAFSWTDAAGKPVGGSTIWSIGPAVGDHFAPSTATFMINYRVEDRLRQVRLGYRSRRKQSRVVAASSRAMNVQYAHDQRPNPSLQPTCFRDRCTRGPEKK
jgi:hypothetical protein